MATDLETPQRISAFPRISGDFPDPAQFSAMAAN
jgi:hypothetical protein